MAFVLRRLALAAGLMPTALTQIVVRNEPDTAARTTAISELDFSDAAGAQPAFFNGINYRCKCYPGDRCWPSAAKWRALNATVGGRLHVHIPPGAPCYNTFDGPLGTVNTYDAAACAEATQNWESESWT